MQKKNIAIIAICGVLGIACVLGVILTRTSANEEAEKETAEETIVAVAESETTEVVEPESETASETETTEAVESETVAETEEAEETKPAKTASKKENVAADRKVENEKIKAVEKGTYGDCSGSDVTNEDISEDALNEMYAEGESPEEQAKKQKTEQANQSSESNSSKNSNESQTSSNSNTASNNDTQKGDGSDPRRADRGASGPMGKYTKQAATQEEINEALARQGSWNIE